MVSGSLCSPTANRKTESMATKTDDKVDAKSGQPDVADKVWIRIPLPQDMTEDEANAMAKPPNVPVCVNGYTYQIRKGCDVQVPRVVADILREARIL